mmetsp:Transcript_15179/g.26084  ORF Transcript_15179/g.26084 Transcript_15179/m.26084 type:complete len:511 (+) Transcript_15179:19-1551(+)
MLFILLILFNVYDSSFASISINSNGEIESNENEMKQMQQNPQSALQTKDKNENQDIIIPNVYEKFSTRKQNKRSIYQIDFEEECHRLTNLERTKMGLEPFYANYFLIKTANLHSTDMLDQEYFSHTGLDGSSPFDRMKRQKYNYTAAAENIAQGQRTPEDVLVSWMNSPGHRKNILSTNYKEMGCGFVKKEGLSAKRIPYYYWTQVFGSPRRSCGNGFIEGDELCDVGRSEPNPNGAKGCPYATCNVTSGWTCVERPLMEVGSRCTAPGEPAFSIDESNAAPGQTSDDTLTPTDTAPLAMWAVVLIALAAVFCVAGALAAILFVLRRRRAAQSDKAVSQWAARAVVQTDSVQPAFEPQFAPSNDVVDPFVADNAAVAAAPAPLPQPKPLPPVTKPLPPVKPLPTPVPGVNVALDDDPTAAATPAPALPLKKRPLPPISPKRAMPPPPAPRPSALGACRALFDFDGEKDGDLQFKQGDVIELLDTNLSWWKGKIDGREGVFPKNYVEKIDQ